MSNDKITRSNLIITKPKDALHKAWLKTAPPKNAFQKNISILLPQKMYFKIATNWVLRIKTQDM